MKNKKALYIFGIAVLLVVVVIVISLSKNDEKTKASTSLPEETYPIQGRDHIVIGAAHDPYNSNPPTSGSHYEQPANWGFYDTELPDEQLVHNLEHGGIWISYTGIDEETLSNLKKIAQAYPGSVVVTSRAKNEQKIILASWGTLKRLTDYDKDVIIDFINTHKNKSPEPIAK